MTSIRDEAVAIDTNVWIFALRKEPTYPACETLLFDKLPDLQIYMPLQIFLELQRNLTAGEMRRVVLALDQSPTPTVRTHLQPTSITLLAPGHADY